MRILLWHVHGSWTTALVQGRHTYVLPVLPDRGPDGRGRAQTWSWPESAIELAPADLADAEIDVVLVQRPHELELTRRLLGRRPGHEVPAVYVEHNAPQGQVAEMRHPVADRKDFVLAHVTHFNDLFWDAGTTPTRVIEQDLLHDEMARCRAYLHPIRWTSLGLSLIEAMQLGMPVAALATTEVVEAVPAEAGFVSTSVEAISHGLQALVARPGLAREFGRAARRAALDRYGLERFLTDWDELLEEVA